MSYQINATATGGANSVEELQLLVLDKTGGIIDSDGGGWYDRRTVVVAAARAPRSLPRSRHAGRLASISSAGFPATMSEMMLKQRKLQGSVVSRQAVIDCYLDSDWYKGNARAGVTYTFRVEGDGTAKGLPQPELTIRSERGIVLDEAWGGRD